jgi:hypothetical protein
MKATVALSATFLALAMFGSSRAQQSICPMGNPQPYNKNGYQFETTSDIDPAVKPPSPYKIGIRSCVHNTGKSGFLANWVIPRAKSWADANGAHHAHDLH